MRKLLLLCETQLQTYREVEQRIGDRYRAFLQMVHAGDMTREDLQRLIKRFPERYTEFAFYLDHLPSEEAV